MSLPTRRSRRRALGPQASFDDILTALAEVLGGLFEAMFGGLTRRLGGLGCAFLLLAVLIVGGGIWWFVENG